MSYLLTIKRYSKLILKLQLQLTCEHTTQTDSTTVQLSTAAAVTHDAQIEGNIIVTIPLHSHSMALSFDSFYVTLTYGVGATTTHSACSVRYY